VPDACRTEAHDGECNKNARPSQPHSKLELIAAIAASMNERTFQLPGGAPVQWRVCDNNGRRRTLQCLFFTRRAVVHVAAFNWLRTADASGDLAQLLLRCLLVARSRRLVGLGLLQNAGPSCDQKAIGVRIANGTMKSIDIGAAPQAGGHIRSDEQRSAGRKWQA
jgi:hypothetical protein